MKVKNLLLYLFISFSSFLSAQEEPEPVKHLFSVRDLYYSGGFSVQGYPDGTLADFRSLAPQSEFLKRDLSNFTENNGYSVNTGALVSIVAGLNFRDKAKNYYRPSPQLRIGFSYFSGADISNSLRYTRRVRYDTVTTSSQTTYVDSVFRSRYTMEHGTKQLRLDASAIFRTSRINRWSLYGGAGLTIGYTISSYTSIAFRYRTSIDSVDLAGHSILSNQNQNPNKVPDSTGSELLSSKNGICYSFYFPIGINFRVGKRIAFLRHVHLFYEMRPGFYHISIPELRNYRSPGMNVCFGMRIAID